MRVRFIVERRLFTPLLVLIAASCGDGNGGGTGPSAALPDVAGVWEGSQVLQGGSPETNCFVAYLRETPVAFSQQVRVEIAQSGSTISGSIQGDSIELECQFTGTVTSSSIQWSQTGCATPCIVISPMPGCRLEVCARSQQFDGTSSGSTITGSFSDLTWGAVDLDTNESGVVTLNSTLRLTSTSR